MAKHDPIKLVKDYLASGAASPYRAGEAMFENAVLSTYRIWANRRGLEFRLDDTLFRDLIRMPCYYCGRIGVNTKTIKGKSFSYNGIDRLNPRKGYLRKNCVPCCKVCNNMKARLDPDDFIEQVRRIYSKHC